jgi:hypothetical protein
MTIIFIYAHFPFFQNKLELVIIHISCFSLSNMLQILICQNLVWSVGCIFYELVHRKPLFPGDANVYICMECTNTFQTHLYVLCKVEGVGCCSVMLEVI